MNNSQSPRPEPSALLPIKTSDAHQFECRVFEAADSAAPAAILFPAMGVGASYYDWFCEGLSATGVHAISVDLRGIGSSNKRANKGDDFGYREMVEIDWPAAVDAVAQRFPDSRRFILGNSLGGQLSTLYLSANPDAAEKLGLIASCSVYSRAYDNAFRIWFSTQFLNVIAKVIGYMPGPRIGFGGYEAKTVISDWASQARNGRYEPKGSSIDYEALLPQLAMQVLVMPVKNDPLAPESAIKHLYSKLSGCEIDIQLIDSELLGVEKLKHSNWGRYPGNLPARVAEWLLSYTGKTNQAFGPGNH